MEPATRAILQSWDLHPWLLILLLVCAGLYGRGWRQLHARRPQRFSGWHPVRFQAGLCLLFLALASPLEALAAFLLQAHMVQHLVLMMVAPPLIVWSAPVLPVLWGLPSGVLKYGLGPLLGWPVSRLLARWLTHPAVAWLAFVSATLAWHVPVLYELALRSHVWHHVQHVCFFGTGILFWWPVLQPWPSRARWPRWAMIPYLFLADLQNTALSAILIFSERILYPTYLAVPRLWGISALDDQAAAGAIMWVPGALVYLVPVGWLVIHILAAPRPHGSVTKNARHIMPGAVALHEHRRKR